MKPKELRNLGITNREEKEAVFALLKFLSENHIPKQRIKSLIKDIVENPKNYVDYEEKPISRLAILINEQPIFTKNPIVPNVWGNDMIDDATKEQFNLACSLPITKKAALMPDAHFGYGVPIGSVLATDRNTVIPAAIGFDIACSMFLTILQVHARSFFDDKDKSEFLEDCLSDLTFFGPGVYVHSSLTKDSKAIKHHAWDEIDILKQNKRHAFAQLSTSGGGNHFVEFGEYYNKDSDEKFLAILSHSGSRGVGKTVASHYMSIAQDQCNWLPNEYKDLAWLDLNTKEGHDYMVCLELLSLYAIEGHSLIHNRLHKRLAEKYGVSTAKTLYCTHNIAVPTLLNNKHYMLHRKGATPANKMVNGIIPGSMTEPAVVITGKGNEKSLLSASHGAGRQMSRRKAKLMYREADMSDVLRKAKVKLISGTVQDIPMAYKRIDEVIKAQEDLVSPIGYFMPKIVKMCDKERKKK